MYQIKKNAIAAALAAIMLAAAIPAGAETVSANVSTGSTQFAAGQTVSIGNVSGTVATGSLISSDKTAAVNAIAGGAGYSVVPVAYPYRYYRGRYYGGGWGRGWYPRYRPVYPAPYWGYGYRYHRSHRW
jgi:hypothetical protein